MQLMQILTDSMRMHKHISAQGMNTKGKLVTKQEVVTQIGWNKSDTGCGVVVVSFNGSKLSNWRQFLVCELVFIFWYTSI